MEPKPDMEQVQSVYTMADEHFFSDETPEEARPGYLQAMLTAQLVLQLAEATKHLKRIAHVLKYGSYAPEDDDPFATE